MANTDKRRRSPEHQRSQRADQHHRTQHQPPATTAARPSDAPPGIRNPNRTQQHQGVSSGRSAAANAAAPSAPLPVPNATTAKNVTSPVSMPETAQAPNGAVAAKQNRSAPP